MSLKKKGVDGKNHENEKQSTHTVYDACIC